MGEKRNGYRVLLGKPEGKGHFGKCGHRWESNTKIILEYNGMVSASSSGLG
jgi:hypothetical protein